jgi:hypothetical protein
MPDASLGRLFRALFDYHFEGKEPTDPELQMPFAFFKNQFEVDAEKYRKRCELNKKNILKRWKNE